MRNEISRKSHRQAGHAVGLDAFIKKGILPCSLMGALVAVLTAVLLAFVLAAILYKTADPARYVTPTAFSALYVSALLGGFTATRLNKGSALLCGLAVGVLLVALAFVASLPVGNKLSSDYGITLSVALRAAVIGCALMGAFIGAAKSFDTKNKKKKQHIKR